MWSFEEPMEGDENNVITKRVQFKIEDLLMPEYL